jgi:hypothetical protein
MRTVDHMWYQREMESLRAKLAEVSELRCRDIETIARYSERVRELGEQASHLVDAAGDWLLDTRSYDHMPEWQALSGATQGMRALLADESRQDFQVATTGPNSPGEIYDSINKQSEPEPSPLEWPIQVRTYLGEDLIFQTLMLNNEGHHVHSFGGPVTITAVEVQRVKPETIKKEKT